MQVGEQWVGAVRPLVIRANRAPCMESPLYTNTHTYTQTYWRTARARLHYLKCVPHTSTPQHPPSNIRVRARARQRCETKRTHTRKKNDIKNACMYVSCGPRAASDGLKSSRTRCGWVPIVGHPDIPAAVRLGAPVRVAAHKHTQTTHTHTHSLF